MRNFSTFQKEVLINLVQKFNYFKEKSFVDYFNNLKHNIQIKQKCPYKINITNYHSVLGAIPDSCIFPWLIEDQIIAEENSQETLNSDE
jgi:hypothetical protein